jgi:hypothetical protein
MARRELVRNSVAIVRTMALQQFFLVSAFTEALLRIEKLSLMYKNGIMRMNKSA